jgi:bifunctional non-homologous end joining protein LigD
MARRDGKRVRLYTRNGYDFADRFPQIVEAVSHLPVQSCFIDGEAIVVDERGLSVFDRLRCRRYDHAAILCAFDLIELDGDDLRPLPIEYRKRRLERILRPARRSQTGITLNEHYEGEGAVIYKHVLRSIAPSRINRPPGTARATPSAPS